MATQPSSPVPRGTNSRTSKAMKIAVIVIVRFAIAGYSRTKTIPARNLELGAFRYFPGKTFSKKT